ncbi:hypothetical protein HDU76_013187 [Blyttiomyces sp. JEL0837]|nr:hypothetical protein HDU76_013187 [Blyttiomyces sp. JEL0837]
MAPSEVTAHGMMNWPKIRLLPGDDGNGYTYARTASHDACQSLPAGAPKTPPLTGGKTTVEYTITAAHQGGCTIYLDRGQGWEVIGSDPACGTTSHSGSISVTIPSGDYSGVIRWYYDTNNGSGEEFNNCADVTVSSTGSNAHTVDSTANLQKCVITNDMACNGAKQMAGFNQCAASFWMPKYCPDGTMCFQSKNSDPVNKIPGEIQCVPSTVNGVVPAVSSSPVPGTSTTTKSTPPPPPAPTTTTTTSNPPPPPPQTTSSQAGVTPVVQTKPSTTSHSSTVKSTGKVKSTRTYVHVPHSKKPAAQKSTTAKIGAKQTSTRLAPVLPKTTSTKPTLANQGSKTSLTTLAATATTRKSGRR